MTAQSPVRRNQMQDNQMWNNQAWRDEAEKPAFDRPRAKLRVLLPLLRAWLLIPRPSCRAFLQKRAKQSLPVRLDEWVCVDQWYSETLDQD
jgi:hypothetical protein